MARILVVDDAGIMRRNLIYILEQAGHEIVAEALDGNKAFLAYSTFLPDLVTMDINMPGEGGVESVQRIVEAFPAAKIIMVTSHDTKRLVLQAIKHGAKHYVLKPIDQDKLLAVIDEVLRGD